MTGENSVPAMIGEYTEEYLLQRAREMVAERTADWDISTAKAESRIPKFHRDEMELGKVLGKGGFFQVCEVKKITLLHHDDNDKEAEETEFETPEQRSERTDKDDEDYILGVVQNRRFMQKHCIRNGKDCRYVLKTMQDVCRNDPNTFVNTLVDMAIEFKFLSAVRHPNIIRLRAMSAGDICQPHAFLILDRLYDTLMDRIEQWKKKEKNGVYKLFDFQKKREKGFFAERLLVAYDIASAVKYLHDLNIIYRDLKPNNIGFDVRGDAKLFDFGLATEYDEQKMTKGGTFKLTGDTGTIRYMAPEVAQGHKYTETADVYSFSILLWQMMKLEMPYHGQSDEDIERKVVLCGCRPKIDPQWPNGIRRLLQDCFASNPRRPSMEAVCDVLRHEINQLSDKKSFRRLTHQTRLCFFTTRFFDNIRSNLRSYWIPIFVTTIFVWFYVLDPFV